MARLLFIYIYKIYKRITVIPLLWRSKSRSFDRSGQKASAFLVLSEKMESSSPGIKSRISPRRWQEDKYFLDSVRILPPVPLEP